MVKTICLRYLLVLIITIISIAVISYILQTYFQINIGSAGSIVTLMIPALDAGTNYFKKQGETPSNGSRWRYAFYFTLIQSAFAGVLLVLFANFIPQITQVLSTVGTGLWAAFMIFYLILILVTSRVFFGMGLNSAEKVANRTGKL